MFLATLFQILFFTSLVVSIFSFLRLNLKMKTGAFIFVLLFLMAPPNIYAPLITERDNLFVFSGCFGLLELFKVISSTEKVKTYSLFKVFGYFSLMAALRKEALFILFALPIIIFAYQKQDRFKNFCLQFGFLFMVVACYNFATNGFSTNKEVGLKNNYNLTSIYYSLGYVLTHQNQALSTEDSAYLQKIVDIDKLRAATNLAGLPYRTWSIPIGRADRIQFYRFALGSIAQHPFLFLESRLKIFEFNLNRGLVPDYLPRIESVTPFFHSFKDIQRRFSLQSRTLIREPNLVDQYHQLAVNPSKWLFVLSHPTLALIFLTIMAFFYMLTPKTSTLTLIPLLHSAIVFFLQPGYGSKYYYFAYTSSFMIAAFFVWELNQNYLILFRDKKSL